MLHGVRLAVAPDVVGNERFVPAVDRVANGLADTVGADDRHVQIVARAKTDSIGAHIGNC